MFMYVLSQMTFWRFQPKMFWVTRNMFGKQVYITAWVFNIWFTSEKTNVTTDFNYFRLFAYYRDPYHWSLLKMYHLHEKRSTGILVYNIFLIHKFLANIVWNSLCSLVIHSSIALAKFHFSYLRLLLINDSSFLEEHVIVFAFVHLSSEGLELGNYIMLRHIIGDVKTGKGSRQLGSFHCFFRYAFILSMHLITSLIKPSKFFFLAIFCNAFRYTFFNLQFFV